MIRLEDTTGSAVSNAIAAERHRMGSPATGMVMTLLIIADEANQTDATMAAAMAAREHPMRILVLIPRLSRDAARLDAEIMVGGDDGPGEVAKLRMHGELAHHIGSVAIPLLLPDTPIVAWWPSEAPKVPSEDEIGAHAQRRIIDSTASARQTVALKNSIKGYAPGDTDLAWTKTTSWRTLLAATLDQPHADIIGAEVSVPTSHASGLMLAAWLGQRLGVPASVINSKGPSITNVRLIMTDGEINLSRRDGSTAHLLRRGMPPATVALPRRSIADLLAEELRRLDPDEVFGEALRNVPNVTKGKLKLGARTKPGKKAAPAAEGPKAESKKSEAKSKPGKKK